MSSEGQIAARLRSLEQHLQDENPVLLEAVGSFQELDRVSRRLGYLDREESHAIRVPWWPLISVLGVYSSGKSTFINYYLGQNLQATGNQAVDDKFTVICYSNEDLVRVLPGLALDADPRFPFYQISEAIDEVAAGEGQRIDAYLQLKTCPSELLRNKIIIDSPGFDADAQRTSTLRITDYIINLSDLVLVFFDARHPEAGSMHDTLEHLVNGTIHRHDSNKFLYVLNQIDTTAGEDNPEQVFAAWQRALAQHGLTAGRCYSIYNPKVAIPIADPKLRERFETKRDADLAEIYKRIEQVSVERAYRIIGMLEHTARQIEQDLVPRIQAFLQRWRRRVLWLDAVVVGALAVIAAGVLTWAGLWGALRPEQIRAHGWVSAAGVVLVLAVLAYLHSKIRKRAAAQVTRAVLADIDDTNLHANYARAFRKNTRWWHTIFRRRPVGWGRSAKARLDKVVADADSYVQKLNNLYTNPSGRAARPEAAPVAISAETPTTASTSGEA